MPRTSKPVCFIAMAFGREDTDLFYEKQILPILKKNNVTPIIINRRVSNDDLNVQIIEQLERADFCIADLTYTRPSVYFEAGFAQRSIPVIYTVRKDHLLEGQPEDLRIHFDLKMKPIIDWENPNDSTFSKRLERRMKVTFLSEWEQKNKKQSKIDEAITDFESMPLDDRLSLLRRKTIYAMRKANISLSKWHVMGKVRDVVSYIKFTRASLARSDVIKGHFNYLAAADIHKKNARCISIQAYRSLLKKDIEYLYHTYYYESIRKLPIEDGTFYKINSLSHDVIVLSLKSVPTDRIENVLHHFTIVERSKCYSAESMERFGIPPPHYRSKKRTIDEDDHIVKINIRFHFLSSVRSELHLTELLDELLDTYLII